MIAAVCFTIFIGKAKNPSQFHSTRPNGRRGAGAWALVCCLAAGFGGQAAAACRDGAPTPEARVVLGLYDSREEPEPRDTRLHRFLELPLNHLGYVVEYLDVAKGAPPARLGSDVAAVATWFQDAPADVGAYEAWAAAAESECGSLRWLALGNPGAGKYGADTPERSAFLARLGIEAAGPDLHVGAFARPAKADPEIIGYEGDFVVDPGVYRPVRALPGAKAHLSLALGEGAPEPAIDLLVEGPGGIYAHGSAVAASDPRTGAAFWVADPFRLIGLLLGDRLRPIPDVTTLNGRRLFFATIGSEGWLATPPALNFGQDPGIAAEILYERSVVPFDDLPQTVAVIAGDLEAPMARAAAERLFALNQVQIGSSGDSGIRNWRFFEREDPAREARIEEVAASPGDAADGLVSLAVRNLEGAFAAADRAASGPRKYSGAPFDLDGETTGAIAALERLAPPGKTVSAYVWSGDARPFADAQARVRRAGYPAIGGGGGTYNRFRPSLMNLWPFAAATGSELQVYDALSGDGAYTGFWTKPMHGFHMLAQTVEATENPQRLKPFHLSYSARSTIDFATRSAVLKALELARTGPFIPVAAADYVRIVEGFATFRAMPDGPNRWRILNRGELQTLRFDGAAAMALDMEASQGVLGARRKGDALYVALSPAAPEPLVALTGGGGGAMRRDPGRFGLIESRLEIEDLEETACGIAFRARGWGAGAMTWAAAPSRSYRFTVEGGAAARDAEVSSGADGRLRLVFPPLQGQSVLARLEGGC